MNVKVLLNILKNTLIALTIIIVSIIIVNMLFFIGICISKKASFLENINIRKNVDISSYFKKVKFNKPSGNDFTKKSIIMFGCGVANGYNLEDKDTQTISAQISKISHRPVYDRSVLGGSIQQAIMQVQNHSLDDIIRKSEYAIYFLPAQEDSLAIKTYPGNDIFDQAFLFKQNIYPCYVKNKDGNLVFYKSKHPSIEGSVLYRIIQKKLATFLYSQKYQNINLYSSHIELVNLHFELLKDELQKINPDIKLIVFTLYNDPSNDTDFMDVYLKEAGIDIINIGSLLNIDIMSEEYRKNDNPTAELWEKLAPAIVKELHL